MALSVFDMALWDALARSRGMPLAALLGSTPRDLQAYDSRGLGLMEPDHLSKEAEALLAKGLKAVKLRLGYPSAKEDIAALKAVRRVVGDAVAIMVDYNQALTAAEAIARGRQLEKEGIYWLEEPILHEDHEAYASIARELDVPIQIGENFNGPQGMLCALRARACDYVMPDVARIGGVTGWMQAAALAAALIYPLQACRIAVLRGPTSRDSWTYASFMTLAKFAEFQGILTFYWRRLRRNSVQWIEYK